METAPAGPTGGATHYLLVTLFPLARDRGAGDGPGAGLILMDVTRRRRAEERLRRSEARFRTLANSLPQLAWQTDADGRDRVVQPPLVRLHRHHLRADEGLGLGRPSTTPTMSSAWRSISARPSRPASPGRTSSPCAAPTASYRWFLCRAVPIRDEPDENGGGRHHHRLVRHQHRHHGPARGAGGGDAGARGRGGREPREEPVHRQHEPRAAHAALGRDRLFRDAGGGGRRPRGRRGADEGPAEDRRQRAPPPLPHQRRARPLQDRGRADGDPRRGLRRRRRWSSETVATVQALVAEKGNTLEVRIARGPRRACTPTR